MSDFVMLATNYRERKDELVDGIEFLITQKLNGVRCVLLKDSIGTTRFLSKNGRPIEGLSELLEEAKNLPNNIVLDGELLLRAKLPAQELYKKTSALIRTIGPKVGLTFNIFDIIDYDKFSSNTDNTPCVERKRRIKQVLAKFKRNWITYVPVLYKGINKANIYAFYNGIVQNGGEGIMINIASAPYVIGRTDNIMKLKDVNTIDLEVVGFASGTGRNEGSLGKIVVAYKGFTVGVGIGFNKAERREIWDNQDQYLGRIAEIEYSNESTDAKGKYSLFQPRFIEFKVDKDNPDQ